MPRTLLRILSATALALAFSTLAGVSAGTANAQVAHDSVNARADAGRIMGNPKATIWVVMASDFQCPFCKAWHDSQFQSLVKNYVNTGRVRVAFLNMPLNIHPNAVPAAEAAMCASVQNKFWPMQEALFATQTKWELMPDPMPKLDSLAFANKVVMAPWRQCMRDHSTLALIEADHERASQSGAGSTPTFFVDGQRLEGADSKLGPVIDAALAKAAKKPAS